MARRHGLTGATLIACPPEARPLRARLAGRALLYAASLSAIVIFGDWLSYLTP